MFSVCCSTFIFKNLLINSPISFILFKLPKYLCLLRKTLSSLCKSSDLGISINKLAISSDLLYSSTFNLISNFKLFVWFSILLVIIPLLSSKLFSILSAELFSIK